MDVEMTKGWNEHKLNNVESVRREQSVNVLHHDRPTPLPCNTMAWKRSVVMKIITNNKNKNYRKK